MIIRKKDKTGSYRYYREGKRVSEATFKRSTAQTKIIYDQQKNGVIRLRTPEGKFLSKEAISYQKQILKEAKPREQPIRFYDKEVKLRKADKKTKLFKSADISSYIDRDQEDRVKNKIIDQYAKKNNLNKKQMEGILQDTRGKQYRKFRNENQYYLRTEVTYKDVTGKQHTINISSEGYFSLDEIKRASVDLSNKIINQYEFLNGSKVTILSRKTYLEKAVK